jgi:creatinine amidohydrolase
MKCQWEQLTVKDFVKTVKAVKGVCLVPLGVLEKHGDHLPLGTDLINVRAVAERAVAQEPALLFPPYFFSQIQEAKQWPGTVAVRRTVLFDLLENVCDEIARNGLRKIVLLNGHGGNESFLDHFLFTLLERPRDYAVYVISTSLWYGGAVRSDAWRKRVRCREDRHGGEAETSLTLATAPDAVKMAYCRGGVRALGRAAHLRGARTSTWWYADYPDHYAGDATHAAADKGEFLLAYGARCVAEVLKAIKDDAVTPALLEEYYGRMNHGAAQGRARTRPARGARRGGRR